MEFIQEVTEYLYSLEFDLFLQPEVNYTWFYLYNSKARLCNLKFFKLFPHSFFMIAARSRELQSKTVLGIINYCRQKVCFRTGCLACKKGWGEECEIWSVIDGPHTTVLCLINYLYNTLVPVI